jgi:cell division protein FtsB
MHIKKIFVRLLLCVEMCVFGYMYLYGNNGLHILQQQKKTLLVLESEVAQLQKETSLLENDIHVWQTNDFYKEKIAREQLQMARKGDKLFYIGT